MSITFKYCPFPFEIFIEPPRSFVALFYHEGTERMGWLTRDRVEGKIWEGSNIKGQTERDKVVGRDSKGSLRQLQDPDRWPPYKFKVRGHSLYSRIPPEFAF